MASSLPTTLTSCLRPKSGVSGDETKSSTRWETTSLELTPMSLCLLVQFKRSSKRLMMLSSWRNEQVFSCGLWTNYSTVKCWGMTPLYLNSSPIQTQRLLLSNLRPRFPRRKSLKQRITLAQCLEASIFPPIRNTWSFLRSMRHTQAAMKFSLLNSILSLKDLYKSSHRSLQLWALSLNAVSIFIQSTN